MSRKLLNLAVAAGIFLFVVILGSKLLPDDGTTALPRATRSLGPPDAPGSSPSESATGPPTSSAGARPYSRSSPAAPAPPSDTRTYAVKLPELQGLPPDVPPGTALELWVAWDPPVTKEPQFQLLLPRVVVEKIIPGITPEAPATVLLRIEKSQVADLLYGDRYGSFSVTIIGSAQ